MSKGGSWFQDRHGLRLCAAEEVLGGTGHWWGPLVTGGPWNEEGWDVTASSWAMWYGLLWRDRPWMGCPATTCAHGVLWCGTRVHSVHPSTKNPARKGLQTDPRQSRVCSPATRQNGGSSPVCLKGGKRGKCKAGEGLWCSCEKRALYHWRPDVGLWSNACKRLLLKAR